MTKLAVVQSFLAHLRPDFQTCYFSLHWSKSLQISKRFTSFVIFSFVGRIHSGRTSYQYQRDNTLRCNTIMINYTEGSNASGYLPVLGKPSFKIIIKL